jgi:hypothetical protein
MKEKEEETVGNYCASCSSPIPPGVVICPKCSKARIAGKKPMESSDEFVGHMSVLRAPEESVRRGVAYGTLTKEQGELLVLLLSRSRLLDFSVRSVLNSLVKEIAEERNAQKKEDRIYILIEFVSVTMPSEDLASGLSHAFKIR